MMAIGRSEVPATQIPYYGYDKTVTPLRKPKGQNKKIFESSSYVALVSPPANHLAKAGKRRDNLYSCDLKKRFTTPPPRASPPKSPDGGIAFAGAKFNVPPSATALPKPPVHWTSGRCQPLETSFTSSLINCSEMSNCLKMLLNVQA